MGVHSERLAASRAHRHFVKSMKTELQEWALEKFGRAIPVAAISPRAIEGVQLLSIPVPPMLEEARGYRGALRFVEFGYSRTIRQFTYSDGGDSIPMLAFAHIRLRMGCVDGERKSCHFAKPHKVKIAKRVMLTHYKRRT